MKSQKECIVTFLPDKRSAKVPNGVTLLDAARRAGVRIPTRCGGKAGCLMCKVTVDVGEQERLSPPGHSELRKLDGHLRQGVRLACQTKIHGDATVSIPEDPLKAAVRRRLEEAGRGEEDSLW